jgi:hypothetical protein
MLQKIATIQTQQVHACVHAYRVTRGVRNIKKIPIIHTH